MSSLLAELKKRDYPHVKFNSDLKVFKISVQNCYRHDRKVVIKGLFLILLHFSFTNPGQTICNITIA